MNTRVPEAHQPLPSDSTVVTFPEGQLTLTATVLYVQSLSEGRVAVLTDVTPVHPLDSTWPDQPADHATLTVGGTGHLMEGATLGVVDPGRTRLFWDSLPVRRGTPGWAFVVCHLLPAQPAEIAAGQSVDIAVDAGRRHLLSRAHTACHAMAFALNRVTAPYWRKEVRRDSLGAPNFDQLTIQRSQITAAGSLDEYRFGRTVRKAGLMADELLLDLADVQVAIQAELDRFLATDARVHMHREGPGAGDLREWVCYLAGGDAHADPDTVERCARIPCGGTHVARLSQVGAVTVTVLPTADGSGIRVSIQLLDEAEGS